MPSATSWSIGSRKSCASATPQAPTRGVVERLAVAVAARGLSSSTVQPRATSSWWYRWTSSAAPFHALCGPPWMSSSSGPGPATDGSRISQPCTTVPSEIGELAFLAREQVERGEVRAVRGAYGLGAGAEVDGDQLAQRRRGQQQHDRGTTGRRTCPRRRARRRPGPAAARRPRRRPRTGGCQPRSRTQNSTVRPSSASCGSAPG